MEMNSERKHALECLATLQTNWNAIFDSCYKNVSAEWPKYMHSCSGTVYRFTSETGGHYWTEDHWAEDHWGGLKYLLEHPSTFWPITAAEASRITGEPLEHEQSDIDKLDDYITKHEAETHDAEPERGDDFEKWWDLKVNPNLKMSYFSQAEREKRKGYAKAGWDAAKRSKGNETK